MPRSTRRGRRHCNLIPEQGMSHQHPQDLLQVLKQFCLALYRGWASRLDELTCLDRLDYGYWSPSPFSHRGVRQSKKIESVRKKKKKKRFKCSIMIAVRMHVDTANQC